MFQVYLKRKSDNRILRKGGLLFVSMTVHTLVVLMIIVVPLVRAETNLPELTITQVTLSGAPPAPGVPAQGNRHGTKKPGESPGEIRKPEPVKPVSHSFFAPTKPPEDIVMTDLLSDSGIEIQGVDGGIDLDQIEVPPSMLTSFTSQNLPGNDQVLRISKVMQPKLIRRVEPTYPSAALLARIEGTVIVDAFTDTYGRVRQATLISGHPLLNEAALDAVRQWVYEPYLVNGMPNPVRFVVTLTFRLSRN